MSEVDVGKCLCCKVGARQYLVRSTGRYPLTLPIGAAADRKRKTRKAAAGTATKKVEAKSGGAKEEKTAQKLEQGNFSKPRR